MQRITGWLYASAITIFSVLMVAFAYDLEQGNDIDFATTQKSKQQFLISLAKILGFKGSIAIATTAICISVYFAIRQHYRKK